eukprot:2133465-Amphidinium_carterae.1
METQSSTKPVFEMFSPQALPHKRMKTSTKELPSTLKPHISLNSMTDMDAEAPHHGACRTKTPMTQTTRSQNMDKKYTKLERLV